MKRTRRPSRNEIENSFTKWLIDTFKQALRKADGGEIEDELLQKFLRVYWITPNPSITLGLSPADLMLARKIRSVFEKVIPNKNKKFKKNNDDITKSLEPCEKICFKEYKNRNIGWKKGITETRNGRLVYIVKLRKWITKRHNNQLKKRYTSEPNYP